MHTAMQHTFNCSSQALDPHLAKFIGRVARRVDRRRKLAARVVLLVGARLRDEQHGDDRFWMPNDLWVEVLSFMLHTTC